MAATKRPAKAQAATPKTKADAVADSKKLTRLYRTQIFVGVSYAVGNQPPTVHEAAENAWNQIGLPKAKRGHVRLLDSKHNAISEYVGIYAHEKKTP